METHLAVVGFVTVAVITPGPNNFIVMAAAARGGLISALPAIGGVVAGSLLLLLLVWAGAGAVVETVPAVRLVLMIAGALYLAWLGGVLVWQTLRPRGEGDLPDGLGLPSTSLGLAAFQLMNPKAWILVLTATTAMLGQSAAVPALGLLAAMFVVIPGFCLLLWAVAGSALAQALRRPAIRRWFDRAMGLLLVLSAALLVI